MAKVIKIKLGEIEKEWAVNIISDAEIKMLNQLADQGFKIEIIFK